MPFFSALVIFLDPIQRSIFLFILQFYYIIIEDSTNQMSFFSIIKPFFFYYKLFSALVIFLISIYTAHFILQRHIQFSIFFFCFLFHHIHFNKNSISLCLIYFISTTLVLFESIQFILFQHFYFCFYLLHTPSSPYYKKNFTFFTFYKN
jgi:hypothetical protein